MSDQCSQGFFCPISFILPLEIYCPYIHHQGIVSIQAFTKICHMSDHNMFMSNQTFINQLCEQSYISLWAIKNILMIAHTLVLSAHRGFFHPISFILPLEIYCPYIQWLHHQGIFKHSQKYAIWAIIICLWAIKHL